MCLVAVFRLPFRAVWSGSVCVVHAGRTRTSWPPKWCALPVGGGAWLAARC